MRVFFVLCGLLTISPAFAYFEFDKQLELSYKQIIALHLDEGQKSIDQEKRVKPGNKLSLLFENQIDFLKAFISEEEPIISVLKKNASLRLKLLEETSGNSDSPFQLYSIAEIMLQDALIRIKSGEYLSAAMEIRKAYRIVEKNSAIFPTFILNRKLSGILHTLIGAVPKEYRWMVELAGLRGSIPQGNQELNDVFVWLEHSEYACFKPEVLFYLANIQFAYTGNEAQGNQLLLSMEPFCSENPLLRYAYGTLALKQGKQGEAQHAFQGTDYPDQGFPLYFLAYKRSLLKLSNLDLSAEQDLHFFLNHFKGLNYVKAAYQKLAWIRLLQNDRFMYKVYMDSCLIKGNNRVEEDKEAEDEAKEAEIPNLTLLRSRLLFDGGNYHQAWMEIEGKFQASFPDLKDQLEFTYRAGRIMQKMKQDTKAIDFFNRTLTDGSASRYYFAANSALQLGLIYETRGDFINARKNYLKCLALNHHDYQHSIDQKAQASLDRLNFSNGKE